MGNKKKKKQKKEQANQEELAQQEKKKKEINIGVVLPLILVLAVVGSVIGTIVTMKFILPPQTVQVSAKTTGTGKIEDDQIVVPLDEFLVNLAKESDQQQYMRITISVLVDDEGDSAEVEKNMALIRDSIVNVLRQKKASDILDAPEGFGEWKKELKDAINADYGKDIIRDVFITDYVIQ